MKIQTRNLKLELKGFTFYLFILFLLYQAVLFCLDLFAGTMQIFNGELTSGEWMTLIFQYILLFCILFRTKIAKRM